MANGASFFLKGYLVSKTNTVPYSVEGVAAFATKEEAEAVIASLPKSLRLRLNSNTDYSRWYVEFRVTLKADGVNGGINETGLKRLKAFTKKVSYVYDNTKGIGANGTMEEEQFFALLA